jgi:hypothetical protein
MRRIGLGALVMASATVFFAERNVRGEQVGDGIGRRARTSPGCSEATLKGTYGIQMGGTRPSGPPPAPTETVIGIVLRIYDGLGGFTQLDNIKGSITGIPGQPRPGSGTYQVNADCTGETQFDPGNGVLIEERLVIVDRGREAFSIVASPLPVMVSTVQKKVH